MTRTEEPRPTGTGKATGGRVGTGPVPLLLLVPATIAVVFMALPFIGLLQRTPWSDLPGLLATPVVADALRLSLVVSLLATAVSVTFGIPLGWVLARTEFRGRALVRAVVVLPMVLPPVVGGAALLFALGRTGLVGQWLDEWFGVLLPFSTAGVVVAVTFVSMPFLVVTVEAGVRASDRRFEDAAATLGADRWTIFRRITLPAVAPSIVAGAVLTWARALGEFGATVTFAGSLQGRTQTMPLAVFLALESNRDAAIALSVVLIAVSLIVLIALRRRWLGQP